MLTGFQLRAARGVLDLFYKDLAKKIGVHSSTLIRLAENTPNLSYLKCNLRTSILLNNFFESCGIICSVKDTLSLKIESKLSKPTTELPAITRFQLKAARISMHLSQKELGEFINMPQTTLSDLETNNDNYSTLKINALTVYLINTFFTNNGLAFPDIYSITLKDDPWALLQEQKKVFDTDK